MDFAIFGLSGVSAYLASRLAAEGFSVGLFGKERSLMPEPVSWETVEEFSLHDFVLGKLSRMAEFNEDFELRERAFRGAVLDTRAFYEYHLRKAAEYGCEILAGSSFRLSPPAVEWNGRQVRIDGQVILEFGGGREIPLYRAARIPCNGDTMELYPSMWVLPAGSEAIVGGKMKSTWHKFENVAILGTGMAHHLPRPARLVDDVIRVGNAAGHSTEEGLYMEEALYPARLLWELLADDGELEVYEKQGRPSGSVRRWLEG